MRREPVQLELFLPPEPEAQAPADEADDAFDYPVHRLVSAADAPPVPATGPSSIFDVEVLMRMSNAMRLHGRTGHDEAFKAPVSEVVRSNGSAKVVGASYPANRWTAEREEAERERRARQKPPKPSKAAKTRGKKVREWDGEGVQ